MICEAIIHKPKRIATPMGTLGQILYAINPKSVDYILNTAYHLFPDSKAAREGKGAQAEARGGGAGRPAPAETATPTTPRPRASRSPSPISCAGSTGSGEPREPLGGGVHGR